jgi:hypothetical protein
MIAVKTNPALDAGSRPATEARADSEPPARPTALSLRGRTNALPPIADISLHCIKRRGGPRADIDGGAGRNGSACAPTSTE